MTPKKNTWKDWVDWAPTYWILGVCLAFAIYKTQILSTVWNKFTKSEKTNSSEKEGVHSEFSQNNQETTH